MTAISVTFDFGRDETVARFRLAEEKNSEAQRAARGRRLAWALVAFQALWIAWLCWWAGKALVGAYWAGHLAPVLSGGVLAAMSVPTVLLFARFRRTPNRVLKHLALAGIDLPWEGHARVRISRRGVTWITWTRTTLIPWYRVTTVSRESDCVYFGLKDELPLVVPRRALGSEEAFLGFATTAEQLRVQAPTGVDDRQRFLASRSIPCPKCGYDLHGARGDRCPECGKALDLDGLEGQALKKLRK